MRNPGSIIKVLAAALVLVLAPAIPALAVHYKISCIGDSITEGTYPSKLAEMLGQYLPGEYSFDLQDHGRGGYKIEEIQDEMESQNWLGWNPDIVLLLAGTNNVLHGYFDSPAPLENISWATTRAMQHLVDSIRSRCNAKIILAAMPPSLDKGLTEWIEYTNGRFATEVQGIDVFIYDTWNDYYDSGSATALSSLMRDRLHPNLVGNWILAQDWFEAIRMLIQAPESSSVKTASARHYQVPFPAPR